jgi:glutamate synthase (NADPH/NADH) large chain
MSMVELEPIADEDDLLELSGHQGGDLETPGRVDIAHDMTRFDAIRLRDLVEKHMHLTDSARARAILDDWENYLPKFVKVMPIDYRRALMERQAQARTAEQDAVRVGAGES